MVSGVMFPKGWNCTVATRRGALSYHFQTELAAAATQWAFLPWTEAAVTWFFYQAPSCEGTGPLREATLLTSIASGGRCNSGRSLCASGTLGALVLI